MEIVRDLATEGGSVTVMGPVFALGRVLGFDVGVVGVRMSSACDEALLLGVVGTEDELGMGSGMYLVDGGVEILFVSTEGVEDVLRLLRDVSSVS